MNSFTQADIAKRCNVTRATVNRWVDLAKEKKNNLQLDLTNKIAKILDNPNNDVELNRLANEAKKYRNSIPMKEVQVAKDFYSYFTEEEVVEIITDLEFKNEVNLKFVYRNGGAENWNSFYQSNISKIKSDVQDFVEEISSHTKSLLKQNAKLNIIDIGPGNSEPVIDLIKPLASKNLIQNYVLIDISNEIIEISKKTFTLNFPDIQIKSFMMDIEYGRFRKIFFENIASNSSNLILLLGNTISNINDKLQTLKNIYRGMSEDDTFALTFSLDGEKNRSSLNYVKTEDADQAHSFLLNKMGVDTDECEIVVEFNEKEKCKTKSIILDKDYSIQFKLFGKTKMVQLEKDERIVVWKHYLSSMEDFIADLHTAGFETLVTRKSPDLANGLVICQAKMN
jgi:uncharacterized SAM-dependent methyltransferase